jgi:hypothetical protein
MVSPLGRIRAAIAPFLAEAWLTAWTTSCGVLLVWLAVCHELTNKRPQEEGPHAGRGNAPAQSFKTARQTSQKEAEVLQCQDLLSTLQEAR